MNISCFCDRCLSIFVVKLLLSIKPVIPLFLFIKLLAGSLVRQCMHADLCCSVFALNCVILMLVVIVRIAIE